jgi:G6PDH family F420-dependent oxidoreductase
MTTPRFGYKLSAEEFGPQDLVAHARRAEQAGFSFAAISDHFHPWTDEQGHSPFVWTALGAIAEATEDLEVLTGVTCPTIRIHPALVAQAAATTAALMPGRFSLGVGTGEALNEHITGRRWPSASVRRDMLSEAIDVIRGLWEGENFNHHGDHFTVENARLYTLPDEPPPLLVAAAGEQAIELAGEKGDGIVALAPSPEIIETFESSGGAGKPRYAEVTVCWGSDEAEARRNAARQWPIAGLGGELTQELPLPRHFEAASDNVHPEDLEGKVACGPDPDRHLENIAKFVDAGYTHIWIHQIGPDQDGFFDFYESRILPSL